MAEKESKLCIEQILAGLGPALFASIRAPFGIFDKNFRIVWINKAMAAIHKVDQDAAVGKPCHRALKGCDTMCDACFMKEVFIAGRTRIVEKWMDTPTGRRWGEVHAYPVRGEDKEVSAVIILVFETTANKQALQRQRDYSDLLEQKLRKDEGDPKKVGMQNGDPSLSVKLSRRETDVLRLLTEGYTNTQISELLNISANTVKSHVNGIFNKMGVNDRTQAAVLATRNHILP